MATRPGAALDSTRRQVEAAVDSEFGAAWKGSHSSPERVSTRGKKPITNPAQLVSRQTWVGTGRFTVEFIGVPQFGTCPQAQIAPLLLNPIEPLQEQQNEIQSSFVPTRVGTESPAA